MTKHYNVSIAERALRQLNSKQGDYLSDEVSGPFAVIPIVPITRAVFSTTSGTITTTPADKDFYLTSAFLTMAKAVGDTGSVLKIDVIVDGVAVNRTILALACITLTAERDSATQTFNPPLKIDRGTAITATATGTFSNIRAGITGYTEEVSKT